jgi:hypothetical protein
MSPALAMSRSNSGLKCGPPHGDEQVGGAVLAHADLDGWVGASELAEGAREILLGRPTVPP